MIACENESECDQKFNKVYSPKKLQKKKTITNLKKNDSSESLQSFESDVIEHDFVDINETTYELSNKIKFKLLDDVDFVNIDSMGNIELCVSLSSNLNILTIDKIKLPKKINVNDINIYSNEKIVYKKDDIFASSNYIKHKLEFSGCDKDIIINVKINNKNINNIIGKNICIYYTNTIMKEKHINEILI
jgi:hypothetical protein